MVQNTVDPWYCAAGRVYTGLLYTKPSTTTPHARGRSGTTRGSSASQPPGVFRPYPPWVVGAGSGRVPGPIFAAGTAAGASGGFLGRREGQISVGVWPLAGAVSGVTIRCWGAIGASLMCSFRALVKKSSVGGFQAAGGDTRPSRGGWQLRVGRVFQ
jgi:hypothetical protein